MPSANSTRPPAARLIYPKSEVIRAKFCGSQSMFVHGLNDAPRPRSPCRPGSTPPLSVRWHTLTVCVQTPATRLQADTD